MLAIKKHKGNRSKPNALDAQIFRVNVGYIGSILEQEVGLKFLSVEKLGLENIQKSKLTGEELIIDGFHQEEAAIDKMLQSDNAVSFESTGVHPYLQNMLASLRIKYNVKLIKIYAPLGKCYERIKCRDQSLHIPISNSLLKKINESAEKVIFNWDLELDNSKKLTINEIARVGWALIGRVP